LQLQADPPFSPSNHALDCSLLSLSLVLPNF
jgi:hypothetical protein